MNEPLIDPVLFRALFGMGAKGKRFPGKRVKVKTDEFKSIKDGPGSDLEATVKLRVEDLNKLIAKSKEKPFPLSATENAIGETETERTRNEQKIVNEAISCALVSLHSNSTTGLEKEKALAYLIKAKELSAKLSEANKRAKREAEMKKRLLLDCSTEVQGMMDSNAKRNQEALSMGNSLNQQRYLSAMQATYSSYADIAAASYGPAFGLNNFLGPSIG